MISFVAPWALWGLFAAAIPVLLHLFARREPPTVEFPAVRYLTDTARLHQRRLTVQHLLLLVLRTLLVVALVLAAAGPTWPAARAATHGPAALALVLDNSLSSGATEGGVPVLDRLRDAARGVLDRATAQDALWLLTADGVIRRGSPAELRRALDSVVSEPRRMDLGEAVLTAREILAGDHRPGEVMVLSDLQASAVTAVPSRAPSASRPHALTVSRPTTPAVPNAGIASVSTGSQPWTSGTATIGVTLAGSPGAPVPLSVSLEDRPLRQAIAEPGGAVTLSIPVGVPGWRRLAVELGPDELRLDDRWELAVRVAPPAAVSWDADGFLGAAADVLSDGGRITRGSAVALGSLGRGASVVLPPADPAHLGAINRSLAARGIPWRYGPRLLQPALIDSSALVGPVAVRVRHPLEPVSAEPGEVLVRVGGEPWMVRSGTVVLLASRMDTAWTGLPLEAGFVPFLDALLNRIARGELAALIAAPGDPVPLPDAVDAVARGPRRWAVEGGARFRPPESGLHFLLAGTDTVGTLSVNPDPRESALTRAENRIVREAWPGARIVDLDQASGAAFQAGARGDLRPALLWLALALLLGEAALAGWRRSRR